MDPLALATAVVNLLIPYLTKAGQAVADKAAAVAWEKTKAIFAAVKEKLSGDTYTEETLKRVEDEPQSQNRRAALIGVLEEQIKKDPAFADALGRLLAEAKSAGVETIQQTVTVSGQARTGDITTIGKVEGSVDMSKQK
jgi:hypothetical protein